MIESGGKIRPISGAHVEVQKTTRLDATKLHSCVVAERSFLYKKWVVCDLEAAFGACLTRYRGCQALLATAGTS